ncbi:hypothetical protein [Streptomyces pinistramenti]|uniref:hypothetical protein n=1 Tax=Streptomyces pinistramenti TaxID=2884812 RepID=UPI001D098B84|nr:hypothetical protein [Streptomyces pinistramenti]MCB5908615.1 hypothetical protein [Streptomyces pinistramenti]
MTIERNEPDSRDDGERTTAPVPAPADEGGISIGLMTGGAVARGARARAEDRSEHTGAAGPAGPVPVPATPPRAGVAIGAMTGGAVAAGAEAHALDASRRLVTVSPELVRALAALRAELPQAVDGSADDGIGEIADQLALVESGMAQTQQAERGRLQRLLALLTSGSAIAGGLASAVAVVQAISALLG